jgi:hypothetical protein
VNLRRNLSWRVSNGEYRTYLTNPYPLDTPVTGSNIIFALLQLKKGRMNFGSLSFLNPKTGFRNTATKSEFDVSGARSPTNILYSFGYCCCAPGTKLPGEEVVGGRDGSDAANLTLNGLLELGIVVDPPLVGLT